MPSFGTPGSVNPQGRTVQTNRDAYEEAGLNLGRMIRSSAGAAGAILPGEGLRIYQNSPLPAGGPFYPFAVVNNDDQNDTISVGGIPDVSSEIPEYALPSRSSQTPGVLQFNGKTNLFTSKQTVSLTGTEWGEGTSTRLLCLKVYLGGLEGYSVMWANNYTEYGFIAATDIGSTVIDWQDEHWYYFPLGWVTVRKTSSESSSLYKILAITWPCTEWLLQGSASSGVSSDTAFAEVISGPSPDDYRLYWCFIHTFPESYVTSEQQWVYMVSLGNPATTLRRTSIYPAFKKYRDGAPFWYGFVPVIG